MPQSKIKEAIAHRKEQIERLSKLPKITKQDQRIIDQAYRAIANYELILRGREPKKIEPWTKKKARLERTVTIYRTVLDELLELVEYTQQLMIIEAFDRVDKL